jgi:solute:Na+ symporter, SSS family
MTAGIWMLYTVPNPATHHAHFGGSAFLLSKLGLPWHTPIYAGFVAVIANVIVAVLGTWIARALKLADGADVTAAEDYVSERV